MKFVTAISICILCLLVAGCKPHIIKETDLIGSWLETQGQTNTFSPEHTFTSTLGDSRHTSNFGTWALDRDHLIVTIYSNNWTSAVASTNSALIARVDADTLVLKDKDEQGNDRTRTYTKAK